MVIVVSGNCSFHSKIFIFSHFSSMIYVYMYGYQHNALAAMRIPAPQCLWQHVPAYLPSYAQRYGYLACQNATKLYQFVHIYKVGYIQHLVGQIPAQCQKITNRGQNPTTRSTSSRRSNKRCPYQEDEKLKEGPTERGRKRGKI